MEWTKNSPTEKVITGYRVGTHIKYEGNMKKEYYVRTLELRPFGKNPKIMKNEAAAQVFLNKVREATGNEDLFIDPVYTTVYKR